MAAMSAESFYSFVISGIICPNCRRTSNRIVAPSICPIPFRHMPVRARRSGPAFDARHWFCGSQRMAVIFGCIYWVVAVVTGYTIAGGKVSALIHISEVITICGASAGALVIMSPKKVLMDLMRGLLQFVKGTPYNKQSIMQLMGLFNALSKMIRRDG